MITNTAEERKKVYKKATKGRKRGNPSKACFFCGESDPAVLEQHHFEGREFSDEKVTCCVNCHRKMSAPVNELPPKTRTAQAARIINIGAMLRLCGDKLIEAGKELSEGGNT